MVRVGRVALGAGRGDGFFGSKNLCGVAEGGCVEVAGWVFALSLLLFCEGADALLDVLERTEVPGFDVLWVL